MGLCMRFITSTNPTNYTCFKLMELIIFFNVILYIFLLIRKNLHWSRNVLRLKFVELSPHDSVKGFKKIPNP